MQVLDPLPFEKVNNQSLQAVLVVYVIGDQFGPACAAGQKCTTSQVFVKGHPKECTRCSGVALKSLTNLCHELGHASHIVTNMENDQDPRAEEKSVLAIENT